jgi:transmembrane sensor
METSNDVCEEAALWVHRLRCAGDSGTHEAFDHWLRQSPNHLHEFYLADFVDSTLDSLSRYPPSVLDSLAASQRAAAGNVVPFRRADARGAQSWMRDQLQESTAAPTGPFPTLVRTGPGGTDSRSRHWRQRWSFAAAAVCVLASLCLLWMQAVFASSERYSTAVGEHRTVQLDDGTIVEMNTASKIAVTFDEQLRIVELIDGEATFTVGRDGRPFTVRVGKAVVHDVGTQFNVRQSAAGFDIVVIEGRIRVMPDPAVRGRLHDVTAGEAVAFDRRSGTVRRLSYADAVRRLAWREGRLVFQGARLSEVVAEFNRYNVRQLEVVDPAVAALTLHGSMSPTNMDVLARVLRTMGVDLVSSTDSKVRLVKSAVPLRVAR